MELAAPHARSVHLIGAYALPGPYSALTAEDQLAHRQMLKAVIPRMQYLARPRAKRPPGHVTQPFGQGTPIMMADTNSVFRPEERYKGWQQGKNGYRALTSPTMEGIATGQQGKIPSRLQGREGMELLYLV